MNELAATGYRYERRANPTETARRRRLTLDVRSAREKLTSSTGLERSFDYELLRQFAQQHLGAAGAMLILAMAIGTAATLWVSLPYVLAWMAIVLTSMLLTAWLCRRFESLSVEAVSVQSWRRCFVLIEAVKGVSWALAANVLLMIDMASARVFVLFVLLMIAAVTSMLSSAIPMAVYSALLPLSVALIGFLQPHNNLDTITMVAMGASAQLYFLFLARRFYSNTLTNLSARQEKDWLFYELEEAKANSDHARSKAEEANLAKSRFLATMSHELRTPLNAILGFSEVMKNEIFGPHAAPAYKEYSGDVHSSGQHLLGLINEILDLSRIEAGRYELNEEAISIGHLVEDCCHMLDLRAKAKRQTVREAIEPGLPRLWADERAVRQIILNLLSNAIKFTPQGGDILIKAGWTASGGQYVSLQDTGPGIPEDEIDTVLASFGRGSLAIKTAEQGSGLGLPIVKGLVELHGGTFRLKSVVRQGTEVIATFPASRVIDALAAVPEEKRRQRLSAA